MLPDFVHSIIWLILQMGPTIVGILLLIFVPKSVLAINRTIGLIHHFSMIIYIIWFLNPFTMSSKFGEALVENIWFFEFFATAAINILYLAMMHISTNNPKNACFIVMAVLTFEFFYMFGRSFCEWVYHDSIQLSVCKFYTYHGVHFSLISCGTLLIVYLNLKNKKKYKSFLYHVIITFLFYNIFYTLPRIIYIYFNIHNVNSKYVQIAKYFMYLMPIINLIFMFLINYQNPENRRELHGILYRFYNESKIGPIPQISVQEAGHPRAHIALHLMRNPFNSFNKLQRRSGERLAVVANVPKASDEIDNQNAFLEIPRHFFDERMVVSAPVSARISRVDPENPGRRSVENLETYNAVAMIERAFSHQKASLETSFPHSSSQPELSSINPSPEQFENVNKQNGGKTAGSLSKESEVKLNPIELQKAAKPPFAWSLEKSNGNENVRKKRTSVQRIKAYLEKCEQLGSMPPSEENSLEKNGS